MSKRVFQLVYDRQTVFPDELQQLASNIQKDFSEDIVLILPSDYSFKEASMIDLLKFKSIIQEAIDAKVGCENTETDSLQIN